MGYFRNEELPSCSTCDYATVHIPIFDRWSDPYCRRGHGKCEVNKLCGDYKDVTNICGRCVHIKEDKPNHGFICELKKGKVYFNGRTCDDFKFDSFNKFSK